MIYEKKWLYNIHIGILGSRNFYDGGVGSKMMCPSKIYDMLYGIF